MAICKACSQPADTFVPNPLPPPEPSDVCVSCAIKKGILCEIHQRKKELWGKELRCVGCHLELIVSSLSEANHYYDQALAWLPSNYAAALEEWLKDSGGYGLVLAAFGFFVPNKNGGTRVASEAESFLYCLTAVASCRGQTVDEAIKALLDDPEKLQDIIPRGWPYKL